MKEKVKLALLRKNFNKGMQKNIEKYRKYFIYKISGRKKDKC